ncbi:DUF1661 domain-containing protein [Porphyromonas gingivalis]
MQRSLFISRTKTKKFTRHVFRGAQTQRNRFVNEPGITRCALSLYMNL